MRPSQDEKRVTQIINENHKYYLNRMGGLKDITNVYEQEKCSNVQWRKKNYYKYLNERWTLRQVNDKIRFSFFFLMLIEQKNYPKRKTREHFKHHIFNLIYTLVGIIILHMQTQWSTTTRKKLLNELLLNDDDNLK